MSLKANVKLMFSSFTPHSRVPYCAPPRREHNNIIVGVITNRPINIFTGNQTVELPNPMTSIKYMAKCYFMEIKAKRKLAWVVRK